MKLSEVIKAIEDGSKSEYKAFKFKLSARNYQTINSAVFLETEISPSTVFMLPLDGLEEVKPPRQWSEKELILFKLLPDWAKWISKDGDDGSVFVYSEIPVKSGLTFKSNGGNSDFVCQTGTLIDDFLTITFEESPVYICDLKGE